MGGPQATICGGARGGANRENIQFWLLEGGPAPPGPPSVGNPVFEEILVCRKWLENFSFAGIPAIAGKLASLLYIWPKTAENDLTLTNHMSAILWS